jgi:hypothetical protein
MCKLCYGLLLCSTKTLQFAMWKLCYAPVHLNNEDLHLALCKLKYTVLQYRNAEFKISLLTLYYMLLQCSSVDLQFELYKLSYTLFQWSIYDMQFAVSHYTICYCSRELVTFNVKGASCVMSWSINNLQIALWKLYYVPLMCINLKFQEKNIHIFSLFLYTILHISVTRRQLTRHTGEFS